MIRFVIAAAITLLPARVWAHGLRVATPATLMGLWEPELAAIVTLLALALLYIHGVRKLWSRAGRTAVITPRHSALFALGWVVLAVATVSPLHALGNALFFAHMVQHELLVAVAAPLLVLGKPVVAFAWAIPQGGRHWFTRAFSASLVQSSSRAARGVPGATAIHALVLWLWHVPALYESSIHNSVAHALQHATFLGSAILFWSATLPRGNAIRTRSSTHLVAAAALFVTVLHTGVLGALITLSSRLWYPHYGLSTAPWGLMPIEDQQLAGLVMWIPGGLVYILVALIRSSHELSLRTPPGRRVTAT